VNPDEPWLARLGSVVDLTSMVTEQRGVVDQTRRLEDEAHDVLDEALLADVNAIVLHENQKKVHQGCHSAVVAAQEALHNAIDELEDASALLKLRATTCGVAGANLCGPHYSYEDACDLHLAATNYLNYLEQTLRGHIDQLV